jgi:ssDNA-specific exonuclease RecJ
VVVNPVFLDRGTKVPTSTVQKLRAAKQIQLTQRSQFTPTRPCTLTMHDNSQNMQITSQRKLVSNVVSQGLHMLYVRMGQRLLGYLDGIEKFKGFTHAYVFMTGFREFHLSELEKATDNFSDQSIIGKSDFASVYKVFLILSLLFYFGGLIIVIAEHTKEKF